MKKLKGFTLIELIVVIAIIGILAAILVPSVMGWVHKSQVATYNNNASELCTQLQTTLTDLETTGRGYLLDSCTITYDKGTVTCSAAINSDVENEIKNISSRLADISDSKWIAEIDHSTIQAIIFTNNDYKQVGGFPHECTPEFRTTGKTTAQMLECARKGWS